MRTRAAGTKAPTPANGETTVKAAVVEPPKLYKTLILPSHASDDARFIQLQNPRTGKPTRYYFCPKLGLFEFTSISPPSSTSRSLLFVSSTDGGDQERVEEAGEQKGFTSKTGQLHVATPIDIIFFILPIIVPSNRNSGRALFQPLDDIIDANEDISPHLRKVLYTAEFRPIIERRMASVCETIDGDGTMFRYSESKLVGELFVKVERMVKNGLPPSLEARFVYQALEPPMLNVSKVAPAVSKDETNGNEQDTQPSQSTNDSQTPSETTATASSFSATQTSASTPITELADTQEDMSQPKHSYSPEISRLMRIRTALSFIQSSYLQPSLSTKVTEILSSSSSPMDFKPLDDYLQEIAKFRAEAHASRSMHDMSRRKRGYDDDETAEEKAEKKRKAQDEEKKKKASVSRGVRDLKKVNTSGMQKLSSFFGKAPAKK
ncbi:uncharacterized protein GIQ15_01041 [Arthroderma uncinatum]|uniref:uncharacterized protein n=1 Tax=Arthroderma uncinatum TaxID=74035 RepID=UPI00144A4EE6|nr:uncharacterized protein GIQ15_01041 [Arthroderma uncinatum]KAF3491524.1 hypothetical protein GIQ15_01041 [Arthroderma uncinatum]